MKLFRYLIAFGLPAFSFFLMATSVALWVRGHFGTDYFFWAQPISNSTAAGRDVTFRLGGGGFRCTVVQGVYTNYIPNRHAYHFYAPDATAYPFLPLQLGPSRNPTDVRLLGFQYLRENPSPSFLRRSLTVPLAFIIAFFGILPARWFSQRYIVRRGVRRRTMKKCPACGYDLRASPDACPECGATVV